MRALLVMIAADLRLRVRNRTVVIFGLLVPLGLISVFHLVIGNSIDPTLEPVTVAVSVPDGDRLGAAVVTAVRSIDALQVTVEEATPAGARAAVDDGRADLSLVVPDGFTRDVEAGRATTLSMVDGANNLETGVVASVVDGAVDQMHAAAVAAGAGAIAGVPRSDLREIARRAATQGPAMTLSEGTAADAQLPPAGTLVAGQAGLFLMFTVGFGVLALLAEREEGTLDRLRSMPIRPGLIITAKVCSAYILGVVATTVLLVTGAYLFDVDFGSPLAVGVLVLCAVAAATSLTFLVARVARTAEQANLAQSILAMVLGVAGGAFFAIDARGLQGQLLDLTPVAAFQRGLGITSGGGGIGDIGIPVAILLGFGVAMVLLSRLLPDRGATR